MSSTDLDKLKEEIVKQYEKRTPKSKQHFKEAIKWLPGGETRNISSYHPYPFFIEKGEGTYLFDVDGNKYIDAQSNMTILLHGHTYPKMVEALKAQIDKGTAHNAPTPTQYEYAKLLCERVQSIDELRFCNSGTEATMFAIRAARNFTKKDGILLIDGCYHGSHDYVVINFDGDLINEGKIPRTSVGKGVSKTIQKDIHVVPYNDLEAVEKVMKKHHKKIAAMIIEPMMGYAAGLIAEPEYLKGLRELTKKYGILLIFDEVITFRTSTGGYQKIAGIKPDLTALGKSIGGGLPIGAFGGRRDIMEHFNSTKEGFVMHSGTLSGNALSMVSGKTAIENFGEKEVEHLGKLGERLREGLRNVMAELDIPCYVGGVQAISFIQFPGVVAKNKKQISYNTIPYLEIGNYARLALNIHGIYAVAKGVIGFILNTIMDDNLVDEIVERFKKAMLMVKPLYDEIKPYQGFAGIIYTMLKRLNDNQEFAEKFAEDDYSLLLVAKDDAHAIKLVIKDAQVDFIPINNTPNEIVKAKTECNGALITSKATFLGLGLGKINPVKAILQGRLKLKGIKYVLKFTKYFPLLRK